MSKTPQEDLPRIDFSTFVLSLSTSAAVHFQEKNPHLVRQTIEILELLQVKTAGNLDAGEEKLLRDLLYDLRLRFLADKK